MRKVLLSVLVLVLSVVVVSCGSAGVPAGAPSVEKQDGGPQVPCNWC